MNVSGEGDDTQYTFFQKEKQLNGMQYMICRVGQLISTYSFWKLDIYICSFNKKSSRLCFFFLCQRKFADFSVPRLRTPHLFHVLLTIFCHNIGFSHINFCDPNPYAHYLSILFHFIPFISTPFLIFIHFACLR